LEPAGSRLPDDYPYPVPSDSWSLELRPAQQQLGLAFPQLVQPRMLACYAMSRPVSHSEQQHSRRAAKWLLLELMQSVNPMMKEQMSLQREQRMWPLP